MTDGTNILANILNKEEFISELEGQGLVSEKIEEEWQKIEKMFSFIYLQKAYQVLPETEQVKVAEGLSSELKKEDIPVFTQRMSEILKNNSEIIDQEVVIKDSAEETMKQYLISLKG